MVYSGKAFFKEVTYDSGHFVSGNSNKGVFKFGTFMNDLDYLYVNTVILPTTYYVFSSPGYVSMTINATNVVWPAGNYTPAEWIAVVAPQVAGLTITSSDITNKLTFTHAANPTITFSATQKSWEMLGFPAAGTYTNGTTTLTPANVIQFSGPNYAILHARVASVLNDTSLYFSSQTANLAVSETVVRDKFMMIPIDQNRNSVVVYQMVPDRYLEWFDASTREMEFYFTLGSRTEVLDLNGTTFQIKMSGYSHQYLSTEKQNANVAATVR